MPKRKRNEPGLEERLAQWRKELVRALKLAKGFERQRMSKRVREADADKKERLEREIAVLKSLDLHQAANAHLCSSLLKIKGIPEAPKLPSEIKQVPRPGNLSEEEKSALHNVTSALCNRKQVKDVIEEAIMGTCIALRVPMPEKKGKMKGAKQPKDDVKEEVKEKKKEKKEKPSEDDSEKEEELLLLRRKKEASAGKTEEDNDLSSDDESNDAAGDEFEGFSDSDAEERAFSRYDDLVGGSSDEDDSDEDEEDFANSRSNTIRRTIASNDDISLSPSEDSSDDAGEGSESSDEDDDGVSVSASPSPPPQKKAKTAKPAPTRAGESAFLPTLMGGYISGSESASDVDVAPPVKKNRKGQKERQAIWEKKYGSKANHRQKEKQSGGREQGWDLRRGAVGGDDDDEGGSRPWKKGIKNPFDKNNNFNDSSDAHVHPDRRQQFNGGRGGGGRGPPPRQGPRDQGQGGNFHQNYNNNNTFERERPQAKAVPAPTKRDDTGTLHPSWAAAKKAKEEGGKIAFQGKKVTFD